MKNMKRLCAIGLTMAIVCAMNITAFAGSGNIGTATGSQMDVKAKYAEATTTPDVYSVNVEWGAMEFTYNSSGTRDWNPTTHTYENNTTASWTASGNTVKVTNHSNKEVTAAFTFEKMTGITEGISAGFAYDTALALAAGVEGDPLAASSVTATLTLSGTLNATRTTFEKVGTVTVTLS